MQDTDGTVHSGARAREVVRDVYAALGKANMDDAQFDREYALEVAEENLRHADRPTHSVEELERMYRP